MATMDPLIGQTIGGYEIVELLGRGGMGAVYRARDTALRRDIALKLLHLESIAEPREAERFRREARLAASLNHPNVVAIHGTGSEQGFLYLAMELVDGESLRARIRTRPGVHSVDDALSMTAQILQALQASHDHGIVHRDIKPENVIVRADETLKVLDFGVARLEGGTVLTRADELLGTVEYMAPEQILGDEVGPAADLYAAGVILYELLTGSQPFAGESAATLVYHQLNEVPASASLLNPTVPRELDHFILTLLDKLPENRFGSAELALGALEEVRRRLRMVTAAETEEVATGGQGGATSRNLDFRFIGRQVELSALQEHFDASTTEGRLVFVAGEAGIGKSRLLDELARHVQANNGRMLKGKCFFQHGMGPYMPFLDAIGHLFREGEHGLSADERQRLGALLSQQAPELAELAARSTTTARVRASFAAAFASESDPEAARQRLFDAVFDLLAAAATERPLTIVLEDLHWADEGSLQMLQSVVRRAQEARILWVVTYRPEELGEEGGLAGVLRHVHAEGLQQEIRLHRLDRIPVQSMVRSMFPTSDLSEEFHEYVYEQSQGNPLIAAEVVRLLHNRDILYCDSGVWTVRADLPRVEVPERIHALIGQRLDQLDPQHRELLQVAAVIGQQFTSELLESAGELSRIALLKALFRLEKHHRLITSSDGGAFEFSHSKVREVLYAEIPFELGREYHRLISRALLGQQQAGQAVDDEALGTHLYGAGQYAEALPLLLRTGEQAFEMFAWRQAATRLDEAVDAAGEAGVTGPDVRQALARSARGYGHLTDYERAHQRCQTLLQQAQAEGSANEQAETWKLTGELWREQRQFEEAAAAFAAGLSCLEGEQDAPLLKGRLLISSGCIDFEQGDYTTAEQRWQQAHELLEASAPEQAANVLNNLAVLHTMRGEEDQAWTLYENALRLDGDTPGPQSMLTLWNMGMLRADAERWEEALALYDRSLEVCRQTRFFYHQPTLDLNCAEALLGRGDLAEARRSCGRALRGYRRLDDSLGLADAMRMYGRLCRLEHNYEDSRSYLERSIEINRSFGDSVSLAEALFEQGLVQRAEGVEAAAIASLKEAETIFERAEAATDLEKTRAELTALGAA